MALFGDSPRFSRGSGGTVRGGDIFLDVFPQTTPSVGPGAYNAGGPKEKVPGVVKLAPREPSSAPGTPRAGKKGGHFTRDLANTRHSYLFAVMSNGIEVFRPDADRAPTPGPGAYTGKIIGNWDDKPWSSKRNENAVPG